MSDIRIDIDPDVYRLSAVKKAAYRFGARCFISIVMIDGGPIRVTLIPKSNACDPRELEGDFQNEVLDQDLREAIAEETKRVRSLLLAHAFSGVLPAAEVPDSLDYHGDPMGISRS
jgi:His-Xaa-Ser system protein HxsD